MLVDLKASSKYSNNVVIPDSCKSDDGLLLLAFGGNDEELGGGGEQGASPDSVVYCQGEIDGVGDVTGLKFLGSSCVDQNEAVFCDFSWGGERLQLEGIFDDLFNS